MPEIQSNGSQREGRPFPWRCPKCRQNEVRLTHVAYQTERLHDGRLVAVQIPNLEVPQCGNCGELVFNYPADEQVLAAVKAQAAVLQPTG
ncbi:MAG TPA: hypothetical protein VE988_05020 [Gemmataceae bacterium]|nr:hypothetical protein [Gemmataceae bacterium]